MWGICATCADCARAGSSARHMALELRISAGRFRGRRVRTPPAAGGHLSFTPSLVKEALFQLLENSGAGPAEGYCFIDNCAGSGQIALEALSRGYEPVLAVEPDRRRFSAIRALTKEYGGELELHARDLRRCAPVVLRFARAIVFLDPPYTFWEQDRCPPIDVLLGQTAEGLEQTPLSSVIWAVQGPASYNPPPPIGSPLPANWNQERTEKKYGKSRLTLLQWKKS